MFTQLVSTPAIGIVVWEAKPSSSRKGANKMIHFAGKLLRESDRIGSVQGEIQDTGTVPVIGIRDKPSSNMYRTAI